MRPPREVPWQVQSEWDNVRQWLYSDNPIDQEQGIRRVKCWESRGKLPPSIDHTATLVELIMTDKLNIPQLSKKSLCYMYSLAIVRFVNVTVDQEQKRSFAQSVASLANQLGVPAWLVDIRHEATHDKLPSLVVLRLAAHQILQWLNDNYWSIQMTDTPLVTYSMLLQLLVQYKRALKDANPWTKKRSTSSKEATVALNNITQDIQRNMSPILVTTLLIPLLLEPGFLVPASKRLKRPSSLEDHLSEDHLQMWQPLLQKLKSTTSDFTGKLIAAMLERLAQYVPPGSSNSRLPNPISNLNPENSQSIVTKTYSSSYMLSLVSWVKKLLIARILLDQANEVQSINQAWLIERSIISRKVSSTCTIAAFILDYFTTLFAFDNRMQLRKLLELKNKTMEVANTRVLFCGEVDTTSTNLQEILALEFLNRVAERLKQRKRNRSKDPLNTNADTLNEHEPEWKRTTEYMTIVPLGCLPNGELPNLDLPTNGGMHIKLRNKVQISQGQDQTLKICPKQHILHHEIHTGSHSEMEVEHTDTVDVHVLRSEQLERQQQLNVLQETVSLL